MIISMTIVIIMLCNGYLANQYNISNLNSSNVINFLFDGIDNHYIEGLLRN